MESKFLIPSAALTLMLLSCGQADGYVPRDGDLAFQAVFAEAPASGFSRAIADATAQRDSVKFVHVGIVASDSAGRPCVIEASPQRGVVCTGWDAFIEDSRLPDGRTGVVIMRVADRGFPVEGAVARAIEHLGEEYDWSYLPDNGKTYCSELVYESYVGEDGEPLFEAVPMNFRDAGGNLPGFWSELFEKLGEPVPEGVPGTNPAGLAASERLVEVFRYF